MVIFLYLWILGLSVLFWYVTNRVMPDLYRKIDEGRKLSAKYRGERDEALRVRGDMICKRCKWWGLNEDGSHQYPGGGDDHKSCECPSVGGGSYTDESRHAVDALNSYSSIGTGPLFGCVHFRGKNETLDLDDD